MITTQNAKNLADNMDTILNLASQHGFKNVCVFEPKLISEYEKLGISVNLDKSTVSVTDKINFESTLEQLIGCKCTVLITDHLKEEKKKDIINQSLDLPCSSNELEKFFNEKLLPKTSKGPHFFEKEGRNKLEKKPRINVNNEKSKISISIDVTAFSLTEDQLNGLKESILRSLNESLENQLKTIQSPTSILKVN